MDISVLRRFDEDAARQAARLHLKAISYSSFITLFGEAFLYQLYKALLEMGIGFLVIAREGGRLEGFILGAEDGERLTSAVMRRPWIFAPLMLPAILKRPSLLVKIAETTLYASKAGKMASVKPELVVIAVEEQTRSKGLGARLVAALDAEMKARGVSCYKVTTHTDMTRANAFYQRNGFELQGCFPLAGYDWNVYTRQIR